MAYLAVNRDGTEVRFDGRIKPFRWEGKWFQPENKSEYIECREIILAYVGKKIPFGSIIAMTGQKITYRRW